MDAIKYLNAQPQDCLREMLKQFYKLPQEGRYFLSLYGFYKTVEFYNTVVAMEIMHAATLKYPAVNETIV